jgi:hypothetical protein
LDADGDHLHRVILGGEYVPEHMDCKQRICPRRLLAQAINGGVYDLMGACPMPICSGFFLLIRSLCLLWALPSW